MFEAFGATFGATLAGCLVLVGAAGAAVYFFLRQKSTKPELQQPQKNIVPDFQQIQSVVYEEIKDVCELALIRKNFASHVSLNTDKKISLLNVSMPGTSRKFFMDYSGTIVCGFDLSGVKILRDEITGNKVKIILPPSKILDAYADVSSFKIHMQDAGIFVENIKIEEQNQLVAADVETQKQMAIQEGLLNRADENARQLLMSRLVSRGLNRNFDVAILTSGDNRSLPPPNRP